MFRTCFHSGAFYEWKNYTTFSRRVSAKIEVKSLLNIKSFPSQSNLFFAIFRRYSLISECAKIRRVSVWNDKRLSFQYQLELYFVRFCLGDFREKWRWKAEAGLRLYCRTPPYDCFSKKHFKSKIHLNFRML